RPRDPRPRPQAAERPESAGHCLRHVPADQPRRDAGGRRVVKYTVVVGERTFVIEIEGTRVLVDGRPVVVSLGGPRGGAIRRLIRERSALPVLAAPGPGRGDWS